MSHDSLRNEIIIIFQRTLLFILISFIQAVALWLWFWMHYKHFSFFEACSFVANAWPLSLDDFPSFMAIIFAWVSLANTSIIYLLLGRWWKKRAEVLHRRGTLFIDQIGGK